MFGVTCDRSMIEVRCQWRQVTSCVVCYVAVPPILILEVSRRPSRLICSVSSLPRTSRTRSSSWGKQDYRYINVQPQSSIDKKQFLLSYKKIHSYPYPTLCCDKSPWPDTGQWSLHFPRHFNEHDSDTPPASLPPLVTITQVMSRLVFDLS